MDQLQAVAALTIGVGSIGVLTVLTMRRTLRAHEREMQVARAIEAATERYGAVPYGELPKQPSPRPAPPKPAPRPAPRPKPSSTPSTTNDVMWTPPPTIDYGSSSSGCDTGSSFDGGSSSSDCGSF